MKKTTPPPQNASPSDDKSAPQGAERIAKVIARAGLCSRRDAEVWIADGRVSLNGRVLDSPAVTVKPGDAIEVDGQPLPERQRTRLWLFHKPKGTVATTHDPEGRPTIFSVLPPELPRVMTVGRLDINTEGLLLLTNDGGLARVLELPATGWLRRYRVRAHGDIDQPRLDALRDGIAIDGILYGSVEATLDRKQGDNVWLTIGLREGKNREVKTILAHLGLDVNRLIRVSFGPFQLDELAIGTIKEVPRRVLIDQLGDRLAKEAEADFALRKDDRQPIQRQFVDATGHAGGAELRAPEARGRLIGKTEQPPRRRSRTASGQEAASRPSPAPRPAPKTPPQPARARGKLTLADETGLDRPRRGRLSRDAVTAGDPEAPRAHKSGRSFEIDRKARHGDRPVTVRGADVPRREDPMRETGRTARPKPGSGGTKPGPKPTSPKGSPARGKRPGGHDADRRR